jgi:hypothetical protein
VGGAALTFPDFESTIVIEDPKRNISNTLAFINKILAKSLPNNANN